MSERGEWYTSIIGTPHGTARPRRAAFGAPAASSWWWCPSRLGLIGFGVVVTTTRGSGPSLERDLGPHLAGTLNGHKAGERQPLSFELRHANAKQPVSAARLCCEPRYPEWRLPASRRSDHIRVHRSCRIRAGAEATQVRP